MTEATELADAPEINGRIKLGQQKDRSGASASDVLKAERQSLRMAKSRIISQLQKLAMRLKEKQSIEPCDVLFVVHEKTTNRHKFFGHGQLLERFMQCKPLADTFKGRENRFHQLVTKEAQSTTVEDLTPDKYAFTTRRGLRQSSL